MVFQNALERHSREVCRTWSVVENSQRTTSLGKFNKRFASLIAHIDVNFFEKRQIAQSQ